MVRLALALAVFTVGCAGPSEDSDTSAFGTETDTTAVGTDPDTEQPTGDPWSGVCTGNGYFASNGGGTTVGSFSDFDGPATATVVDELSSGAATCLTTSEQCDASWTDQPLQGAWTVELRCAGSDPAVVEFALDDTQELPNARFASTQFVLPTSTLTANLTLSLTPD